MIASDSVRGNHPEPHAPKTIQSRWTQRASQGSWKTVTTPASLTIARKKVRIMFKAMKVSQALLST